MNNIDYVEIIKPMIKDVVKNKGDVFHLTQLIVKLHCDCYITDDDLVDLICDFYIAQFDDEEELNLQNE